MSKMRDKEIIGEIDKLTCKLIKMKEEPDESKRVSTIGSRIEELIKLLK